MTLVHYCVNYLESLRDMLLKYQKKLLRIQFNLTGEMK